MPGTLNYKHLYYFWVIAREGSLVRASELLDLAPQTLSSQLTALEESIGSLLFRREHRRLVLTDLGQTTFRYADEMFRVADELKSVLDSDPADRPLTLSVGVAASIHKLIAYQLLEPAIKLDRQVHISCHTGGLEALLRDLKSRRLDVVLSDRLPESNPENHWGIHTIGQSSISLFAIPELAAQLRDDFPQSMHNQAFLANAIRTPYAHQLMQWFHDQGIRLDVSVEIDDSALLKVFGRNGFGVFAAPTVIRDEVCRQYQVEMIGEVESVTDTLYAISRNQVQAHPAVEAICTQGASKASKANASKKTD
ncbi:transcriptional activator NhaR [Marinobacter mobilis]|uniref:Transcriptional regulator n=1 Tax=Marinobacter mobilis TaxID=488533 RepID=A0A1H2S589_9GAMM|nr:transcriptional activator NhaR [Marinobacter mobilis]SDW26738.1 transcriptional regulator [Marinobacter mobilis]